MFYLIYTYLFTLGRIFPICMGYSCEITLMYKHNYESRNEVRYSR